MPVTTKDIAKCAGVHHSSVSRALRNDPQMAKETCRRIQALARKMGYQPNPALTALVAYRSQIRPSHSFEKIAVLCPPDVSRKQGANIWMQMEGIRARCAELGFQPEAFPICETGPEQVRLSKNIYNRGIRGVIVTALPYPITHFAWDKFCAVGIAENSAPLGLHYVSYDQDICIQETYRQLRSRGYQNIGYTNEASSERRNRHLKLSAYIKCRCLDGLAAAPYFIYAPQDRASVPDWVRSNGLDAVIINDIHMVQILKEQGFVIPSKLGLAMASGREPSVSENKIAAYVIDRKRLGVLAVEFLQSQIHKSAYGLPSPDRRTVMLLCGHWKNGWTLRPRRHRRGDTTLDALSDMDKALGQGRISLGATV